MTSWPEHKDPSQHRKATAPYNFVPLPETVVAVDLPPDQDRFDGERHTGYLDCTLVTLTPLYTRCMMSSDFFEKYGDTAFYDLEETEQKERAHFFYLDDIETPVIPGSSLRGMARALVEIIGYGKVSWVTNRKLFFRTVAPTSLGDYYRKRIVGDKVEGGFLRQRSNGSFYIKKCHVSRVRHNLLGGKDKLYGTQKQNKTPRWSSLPGEYHQHQPVWVQLSENNKFVTFIQQESDPNSVEGRLVITGDVPVRTERKQKKKEFVFLLPDETSEEIDVDEELLIRFQDDDQLTQWQEQAFPADKPAQGCRLRDGLFRKDLREEGDPVFFLREDDNLTFFGRAQMFRLPYDKSPLDMVPESLRREEEVDLAEAIFGYVKDKTAGDGKQRSCAGRVFFSDAACQGALDGIWLSSERAKDEGNILRPKVLSSPKPTSFQHYLTQDKPDEARTLYHYGNASPGETVIRGHKLYWHKQTDRADIEADPQAVKEFPKQHTRVQPVKPGVKFQFKVHFENLSGVELGALLWALDLPEGHYHKLGMGKPLGMGSVAIRPQLFLNKRLKRYKKLFTEENNNWYSGFSGEAEPQEKIAVLKKECETFILKNLKEAGTAVGDSLQDQERIAALLILLQGAPSPARALVDYLPDLEAFKARPVLPTPERVVADAQNSGGLSNWIEVEKTQAALEAKPLSLQHSIGDRVKGKIVDLDWPGGPVRVELDNGEPGQVTISKGRFRRSSGREMLMEVTGIKPGGYELKFIN